MVLHDHQRLRHFSPPPLQVGRQSRDKEASLAFDADGNSRRHHRRRRRDSRLVGFRLPKWSDTVEHR